MSWSGEVYAEPLLGDVTLEYESERFYLVSGIEEHRDSPRVWWLTLERIDRPDAEARVGGGARYWEHSRDRR